MGQRKAVDLFADESVSLDSIILGCLTGDSCSHRDTFGWVLRMGFHRRQPENGRAKGTCVITAMFCQGMTSVMPQVPQKQDGFSRRGSVLRVLAQTLKHPPLLALAVYYAN